MTDYRLVKYTIKKKGRKWFEGEVPGKGWKAKIEINEVSEKWNVGETVEFYAQLEIQRSRYGTTVKVYPVSAETVKKAHIEELKEQYRKLYEELGNYGDNTWYPSKKLARFVEIAEEIGNGEEAREFAKNLKAKVNHNLAWKKYKECIEKIKNLGSGDRLSYLNKLVADAEQYARAYEDINEDYIKNRSLIEERRKEVEVGELKRKADKIILKIENSISKYGLAEGDDLSALDGILLHLKELGEEEVFEKYMAKYEEFENRLNKVYKENFKKLHPDTFSLLKREGVDEHDILLLIMKGKLKENVKYVDVGEVGFLWRFKKMFGGVSVVAGREQDEHGVIRVKALRLVPEENLDRVIKLREILSNEGIYSLLKSFSLEGDAMSDEEMEELLPKTWNHYKREFVAVLNEDLRMNIISRRKNYTRSGANAELETELPTEVGTLLLVHSGSHKHMNLSLYRRDEDGWKFVVDDENAGGYYGGNPSVRDLIAKFVEEKVIPHVLGDEKKEEEKEEEVSL